MARQGLSSRRSFLAILGAGASAALIAACSGSQPAAPTAGASAGSAAQPTAGTSATQPAANAAPASAGSISLAFWSMPIAGGTDYQTWLKNVGSAYTTQHPNVKIDPLFTTWDMIQKVDTSIAGGSPPDILGRGSFGYLINALKANVAQEVTLPDDLMKDLPEGYYDAMKFKGKNYFIPWFVLAQGPRLNLTLVKEAKAESLLPKPPDQSWTWEQWLDLMKAVTRKRPNGQQAWGTMLFTQTQTPAYHWETFQFFWNQGVHIYRDPVSSACSGLNTEAGIKVLQFLQDLYSQDKIVPNPSSTRATDVGTQWDQGTLAYQNGGPGLSGAQAKGEKIDKKAMTVTDPHGFEWMFVQNPTSSGVKEQCWGGPGIDVHLQPFKQKDDARMQSVLDFGFFLVNPQNQEGMIPFEIPVRTSVVKDKLSDAPLAQYTAQYLVPGSHGWPPDGNSTKYLDIFNTHFQDLFLGKSATEVANAYSTDANAATGCTAS